MSYAVRNSLVLLVVLLLFAGGGWAYLYYFQSAKIDELEKELSSKSQDLRQKQEIASQYPVLLEKFDHAKYYFKNYDKALYLNNNEDRVFDFLDRINSGNAYTDFTFAFRDSTEQGEYGVLNMDITGEGYYRNLVNFIRKIEFSKPLNKVRQVTITPINNLADYGKVTYSMELASYYDRIKLLDEPSFDVVNASYASVYNPFYPLIRDVEPNENNLPDVEESKLFALSSNRIFLLDQDGIMQKLRRGDNVYLGKLAQINLKQRSATFELNKGGIYERVTLRVENETK